MKSRNIFYNLIIVIFITTPLWAQNTYPVVTNVAFSISGTTVTVTYDVTDTEQSTVTISMEVSNDNGATWEYNYGSASGNIGSNIAIGTGKTITWTYTGGYSDQFIIRIIANDLIIDGGPCADPTILYSGKIYNTVQIRNQCWLKENLDVGTMINSSVQQTDNETIEKYCYGNNSANCDTYGGLYTWDEAVQYTFMPPPGTQGICPSGWHMPSYNELSTLRTAVSSSGNALKAIGQGTGSGAGTNTSGFSALLAGWFNTTVSTELNSQTYFWSSDEGEANEGVYLQLSYNNNNAYISYGPRFPSYSVRCLKDN